MFAGEVMTMMALNEDEMLTAGVWLVVPVWTGVDDCLAEGREHQGGLCQLGLQQG